MQLFDKIKDSGKKLISSGFVNIFSATIINSVVSFVYGVFIVRILSKYDYGVFSYAQNIVNFGIIFCTLGLNLGVLQYCSQNIKKELKYQYCKFAAAGGFIGSLIVIIVMNVYCKMDHSGIKNLSWYILEYSLLPFLYYLKDWICSCLRWKLRNREYSNVLNVHSVLNACCAVFGAFFAGIHGVIWGIYFAYVVAIVIGFLYLKEDIPLIYHSGKLTKTEKKGFLNYSVIMCVTNALISVLFTIDIFVIGNILKDANDIASYKTASVIPFALNMIPNAVMTFLFPHVARNKTNENWLKKNIKIIYMANGALNIIIGIGLYITAPVIINILFGTVYANTMPMFRILVLSYIVSSSIRTPSANLLGMLEKSKTALAVSFCTVFVSALNSIYWVNKKGIVGAAIGSVLTFSFVGVISFVIIIRYVYGGKKNARKEK